MQILKHYIHEDEKIQTYGTFVWLFRIGCKLFSYGESIQLVQIYTPLSSFSHHKLRESDTPNSIYLHKFNLLNFIFQ